MSKWRKSYDLLYGSNLSDTHRSLVTPSIPIKRKRSLTGAPESERKAQQRLVAWLHEEKIPVYAIPNGANVAAHHRQTLIAEGLSPGCPDLCIPLAKGRYHGLYIELKRDDGGSGLSESQKKWISLLKQEGYYAIQCNGYQAAKDCVTWYISLGNFSAG